MKKWWLLVDAKGTASGHCDEESAALSLKKTFEDHETLKDYLPYKIIPVMEVPVNYDEMVNLGNLGSIVKSLVKILGGK